MSSSEQKSNDEKKPRRPGNDSRLVLICDDHEPTQAALSTALVQAGYYVVCTETVRESLLVLSSTEVLAVIADLHLTTGANGTELLAACRQWHPHVLRFLMTADFAGEELAAEWYASWIDKAEPGSFGKLVKLIRGVE
jgi:DNA-binding NtrC family response regulator